MVIMIMKRIKWSHPLFSGFHVPHAQSQFVAPHFEIAVAVCAPPLCALCISAPPSTGGRLGRGGLANVFSLLSTSHLSVQKFGRPFVCGCSVFVRTWNRRRSTPPLRTAGSAVDDNLR